MKPKIKIELTKTDWLLEILGALGLILSFVLLAFDYNDLPAIIPKHFSATGQPDGFGDKTILWSFPIIGLIIYLGLTIGTRFPHLINYPFEITPDNSERQYKNSVRMARVLKTAAVLLLLYLTYTVIQYGYGRMSGLGILFLPVVVVTLIIIIGVFIYRGFKLR